MNGPSVELRFGIQAQGRRLPAWAAECIGRLQSSGHARLAAVLELPSPALSAPRGAALLPRLYRELWVERRSLALRPTEVTARLAGVPGVDITTTAAGSLSEGAFEAIADLDFVLWLDASPAPAVLLSIPRFGVWSFCQERRAAPCFREVVEGRTKTRVALERLTPGGAACLHEGYFATCRASWVNNIDRARLGAADFCARVCAEIVNGGGERILGVAPSPVPEDRAPTNSDVLCLFARSAARSVEKLWELLFHVEVWNVGFSGKSIEQILAGERLDASSVTWCKPHRPGHCIADPFAYVRRGETCVIVEEYDQVKGRISTLEPDSGDSIVKLSIDLDLPCHLSYPCIFEEGGEIYCVPEAYQSGSVSLYRRTDDGWVLERTLLEGLPVVDPTLFKHEARYWILCTLQNDGAWGSQKLYAYHAPSLAGPWEPHALNPLKCDVGSTRPAGNVVRLESRLFRPSQDSSATYGGAVVINEILELSPTTFMEREVARIEPIAGSPYPEGLHTLNALGSGSVFDSKKYVFDGLAWRKNWGRLHEVLR